MVFCESMVEFGKQMFHSVILISFVGI